MTITPYQNPVQNKLKCLFETTRVLLPQKNPKAPNKFKIKATQKHNEHFITLLEKNIDFNATEKVDGTSCLVHNGTLHKRRDLKLNKEGTKLVDKYFTLLDSDDSITDNHTININNHFQPQPDGWIMSEGARRNFDSEGNMLKIERHCIGWMPVLKKLPDDKWHAQALNWDDGTVRVVLPEMKTLGNSTHDSNIEGNSPTTYTYRVEYVPLTNLEGKSLELIGPKIQRNVYDFPKNAKHAYLIHGSIPLLAAPTPKTHSVSEMKEFYAYENLKRFFEEHPAMEGIVIHFATGELFKVHREHLGLEWPVKGHKLHLVLGNEVHGAE